ncbi:hypothetical protein COTS27_01131 [Spirochaetota bacterium]|nr:hypothetical protein COTS27_01131 [Spirochaetota bacterium]
MISIISKNPKKPKNPLRLNLFLHCSKWLSVGVILAMLVMTTYANDPDPPPAITNLTPILNHNNFGSDRSGTVIIDDFETGEPRFIGKTDTTALLRDLTSNKIYRSPRVPVLGKAITTKQYNRVHKPEILERARDRIKQSVNYLEEGDNKVFIRISQAIIRQYHFSEYAAEAAFNLAQFYESNDFTQALYHYVYIINIHANSSYQAAALYRLAVMLDREKYYLKSEALLRHLLKLNSTQRKQNLNTTSQWAARAHHYLKDQYQSILTWATHTGRKATASGYKKKLAKLIASSLPSSAENNSPPLPTVEPSKESSPPVEKVVNDRKPEASTPTPKNEPSTTDISIEKIDTKATDPKQPSSSPEPSTANPK